MSAHTTNPDLPTHKKSFQETRAPKHDFSGNLRLLSGMHHIGDFRVWKHFLEGFREFLSAADKGRLLSTRVITSNASTLVVLSASRVSFCLNTELTEGHVLRNSAYSLWCLHATCLLQSLHPPCPMLKSSASATVAKGCNFHRKKIWLTQPASGKFDRVSGMP